jgi:hypothetical protein
MTARSSIARLADCAPVAEPDSWVERKPPSMANLREQARDWLVAGMEKEARAMESIWRANMARRDADAREHGEPRDPHEFYRGRKP